MNEFLEKAVKNRKTSLFLGAVCIIAGLIILSMPTATFTMIGIAISVILFIVAIVETINIVKNEINSNRWIWHSIAAAIALISGIVLLVYPSVTMMLISLIIAFWLLYCGISTIKLALLLKENNIQGSKMMLFYGVLLIIIAVLMILMPVFAAKAIAYATGIALIISGIFLLSIGLKLDQLKRDFEEIV